ncbi:MAG: superoxide dismutase family protein [Verrucomicrobia bacterium]|nr:superoxide dismutase family protein [Verrucomicrobiota bacterium]
MRSAKSILTSSIITATLWALQCSAADPHAQAHQAAWSAVTKAVAAIHATQGNKCHGTVQFSQVGDKVKVVATIEGLTPNQKHAIHIHETGDCTSADGMSAGGHYNPEGHQHGLVSAGKRHAGDLGNLQADANGKAHYEVTVDNISLVGLKNPILGRAVIIHAKEDDGGQPVGNAGARLGCGVIGIAKSSP